MCRAILARWPIAALAFAALTAPAAATATAATTTTISVGTAFSTIAFGTSTVGLFAVRGFARHRSMFAFASFFARRIVGIALGTVLAGRIGTVGTLAVLATSATTATATATAAAAVGIVDRLFLAVFAGRSGGRLGGLALDVGLAGFVMLRLDALRRRARDFIVVRARKLPLVAMILAATPLRTLSISQSAACSSSSASMATVKP